MRASSRWIVAADAALDVRDVDARRGARDDDGAQVEQRDRGAPADAEDALLAPEQAVVAVEDERAAQRPEQDAHRDHDARRAVAHSGRSVTSHTPPAARTQPVHAVARVSSSSTRVPLRLRICTEPSQSSTIEAYGRASPG